MKVRIERDSMGAMEVPAGMHYGAQTARAVLNFPISGRPIGREMIRAMGWVKIAAARANRGLGLLDPEVADAIVSAAREVARGELDEHFPVDVFQTGSGTSSNMNANEVIAHRASELLEGSSVQIHPNDQVNLGQSSNDVFPTAIHVAAIAAMEGRLVPALGELRDALASKSRELDGVVKIGRTHLMEATPLTLGQEISGFASQIEHGLVHLEQVAAGLRELAVGGTAVGTGINTHPDFGRRVAEHLSELTGTTFREAENHFEAQAARDAAVRMSGALRSLAVSLIKIADDIRWLGSGPRHGLAELELPPVQPGSSIMPGKVNPVIAEALIQAAAQVIGNDAAITVGGMLGNFQLNTMQPLIARNLLEQIDLLANGARVFSRKLVEGIRPNIERIAAGVEGSAALATALAPRLGYSRVAELVQRATRERRTVREVVLEEGLLGGDDLDVLLDPKRQTGPADSGGERGSRDG